jgi:transcriptional regulator GlxA family with amidase domain
MTSRCRLTSGNRSSAKEKAMQIAIVLFDHLTALDADGPYEVFSRFPGAQVVFTAERAGVHRTDTGMLGLVADASLDEVTAPDIVFVPGGFGQSFLMEEGRLLDWLCDVDRTSTWTASTCTGSLLLAAAGLLRGRRATTHWLALDELAELGARPASERVVEDGKYVTAAGVSAGIDLALTLAERVGGSALAQMIQLGIEYDPQPPHDAGTPAKAPASVRAAVEARRDLILRGPAFAAAAAVRGEQ